MSMLSKHLNLNKSEKYTLLGVLASTGSLVALSNVYWVAAQFGIHLAGPKLQRIIDMVANGSTLGTAFAAIAGVTLPAWALAAAGAMGATAA